METKTETEEREPLHLFRYSGEIIAARDHADAVELWEAAADARVDDERKVYRYPDERRVAMLDRKQRAEVSKPAAEWATENGRGIVASLDW